MSDPPNEEGAAKSIENEPPPSVNSLMSVLGRAQQNAPAPRPSTSKRKPIKAGDTSKGGRQARLGSNLNSFVIESSPLVVDDNDSPNNAGQTDITGSRSTSNRRKRKDVDAEQAELLDMSTTAGSSTGKTFVQIRSNSR